MKHHQDVSSKTLLPSKEERFFSTLTEYQKHEVMSIYFGMKAEKEPSFSATYAYHGTSHSYLDGIYNLGLNTRFKGPELLKKMKPGDARYYASYAFRYGYYCAHSFERASNYKGRANDAYPVVLLRWKWGTTIKYVDFFDEEKLEEGILYVLEGNPICYCSTLCPSPATINEETITSRHYTTFDKEQTREEKIIDIVSERGHCAPGVAGKKLDPYETFVTATKPSFDMEFTIDKETWLPLQSYTIFKKGDRLFIKERNQQSGHLPQLNDLDKQLLKRVVNKYQKQKYDAFLLEYGSNGSRLNQLKASINGRFRPATLSYKLKSGAVDDFHTLVQHLEHADENSCGGQVANRTAFRRFVK